MRNIIDTLTISDINKLIENMFPSVDLWFVRLKYDFIDTKCISFEDYLNSFSNYNTYYYILN